MARIAGVDLPNEKRVDIALTYIYGIGKVMSQRVLIAVQIEPSTKVKSLTEEEIGKLNSEISTNFKVEGDLRREISSNIKRLMDIGAYRGSRHRRNLPCRGQRTRTNARTRRGKRKTVGSARIVQAKAKPAAQAQSK
ncbi:MAG: 30S ribosomal protein S13 [Elusimicrobia bacterium RIFOXYA2_FULL_39_19]|nr:MAG: 30S ribosomal protein S13 [Elusimicrobia bacterium RIFOXYA2_FULL_39_19]